MPSMSEIKTVLEREIHAIKKPLAVLAQQHQGRWAGPGVEADDLFQEGVLGAYRQLSREMAESPENFASLSREELQGIILRIASRVMRNKICDGHRRTYRRPYASPSADTDDRLREAIAAREDLQAIEAALTGPSLTLFRLVVIHGQDDVPHLARAIDRSVAQTYRLLALLKSTAQRITGRAADRGNRLRPGSASVPPNREELRFRPAA
jgi:DNA-directed RNA polymerase specialized sigma24 family protein